MNTEKVVFAFFILLAASLNFSFFLGGMSPTSHYNVYELFAALVISLIATVMKFGDRSHMGAVLLATSLVADVQLLIAASVWGYIANTDAYEVSPSVLTSVVSMSGGALLANLTSVVLLVVETVTVRR